MAEGSGKVFVGAMRADVFLPGVGSLKGKRSILNKAKAALRNDLEVSVAEVAFQDVWQRASLGVAVAASTERGVDRVLDRVVPILERDPRLIVTGSFAEVLSLEDMDLGDIPPGF